MSSTDKTKRAAKRYTYSCMAQCEFETQKIDVQILNISSSGIQFSTQTQVETKNPIRIVWTDQQFGNFDVTFLIAREIDNVNDTKSHYYGCQYFNLKDEVKSSLRALLQHFKEQAKKEIIRKAAEITPESMLEVVGQGNSYLQRIFTRGEAPAHFDEIIKNIKDYEKSAFESNDEVSLCIQKLTTCNFHCNLFGMITPLMVGRETFHPVYFSYIQSVLARISEVESETEALVKKVMEGGGKNEDKKSIQIKLNESNNRLFYTKQSFLQSIVETFNVDDYHTQELKLFLESIKGEYDRILKLTNSSFKEANYVHPRSAKKSDEFSKSDTIADIKVPTKSKSGPSFLVWFGSIIVLAYVAFLGYEKFFPTNETEITSVQMNLPINVLKYQKNGLAIIVTVSRDEWKRQSTKSKKDIYIKIIQFLKNSKEFQTCVLFDDHHKAIRMLHRDMPLDMNFRDLEASTQAPKPAPPNQKAR